MSAETLGLLNEDRKNTIELSPFSELFSISSGGTFYGIFDESHIEDNKDSGNVLQKKLIPRIMVDSLPDELIDKETESKITREGGTKEFTFSFYGFDKEGVGLIWLY